MAQADFAVRVWIPCP